MVRKIPIFSILKRVGGEYRGEIMGGKVEGGGGEKEAPMCQARGA